MWMRASLFTPQMQGCLFRWQTFMMREVGIPLVENFWHWSRSLEYPWAWCLGVVRGRVLDIGSETKWLLALLSEADVEHVTAHFTHVDTPRMAALRWGDKDYSSLSELYSRDRERLTLVWAMPDQFEELLRPESYDCVTNFSVVEHTPPDQYQDWLTAPWRLVKPGGHLVLTVDYMHGRVGETFAAEHPAGWIRNYDLWPVIEALPGAELVAGIPAEIPGHPSFEPSRWEDADLLTVDKAAIDVQGVERRLGVYGLVLRKRP